MENNIQKFIECLQKRAYALSLKELEVDARNFGFKRIVPNYVFAMQNQCPKEAYQFSASFVLNLADLDYVDGRGEASYQTAQKIADYFRDRCDVSTDIILEMSYKIQSGAIHPTIRQQMASVAFAFLDNIALRDTYSLDPDWWIMPLI